MWDGTTMRMIVVERPYDEFMIFAVSVQNILDTTTYKKSAMSLSNTSLRIAKNLRFTA
jgi:hypothetical protein